MNICIVKSSDVISGTESDRRLSNEGKHLQCNNSAHLESCAFLIKLLKMCHGIQSFLVTSRNKANSSQDFQHYKEQIIIKYGQYSQLILFNQFIILFLTLSFYIFPHFSLFKGFRLEAESSTFYQILNQRMLRYTFQNIQKSIICLPWILVLAFSALML